MLSCTTRLTCSGAGFILDKTFQIKTGAYTMNPILVDRGVFVPSLGFMHYESDF